MTFRVNLAISEKSMATSRSIMSRVIPGIMQIRPCLDPSATMKPRKGFSAKRPSRR